MGHAVLNLADTVAITENFMPTTALDLVAEMRAAVEEEEEEEEEEGEGEDRRRFPTDVERMWRNLVWRDLHTQLGQISEDKRYPRRDFLKLCTYKRNKFTKKSSDIFAVFC